MKGIYGEEIPVARGKKHTYVGMYLDYCTSVEVIVSMGSYITEAIEEFPKEMMKSIKTPAGNHLFKVDDACKKLCDRYASGPISMLGMIVPIEVDAVKFRPFPVYGDLVVHLYGLQKM